MTTPLHLSATTRPSTPHSIDIHTGRGPLSQHDKLIQQTRKWVALAFFEPMLKQMRQSPFHSDLLDGGHDGEAFTSMYDERLSERMSSSSSDTLVQSIVRRIEAKRAYAKQSKDKITSEREGADRVNAARAAAIAPTFSGDSHVPPHL